MNLYKIYYPINNKTDQPVIKKFNDHINDESYDIIIQKIKTNGYYHYGYYHNNSNNIFIIDLNSNITNTIANKAKTDIRDRLLNELI